MIELTTAKVRIEKYMDRYIDRRYSHVIDWKPFVLLLP